MLSPYMHKDHQLIFKPVLILANDVAIGIHYSFHSEQPTDV
jgi:hypothetical protein